MRTLKKSLALVLALVMVLGLGVVGASADNKLDSYTDAGEIGDAYVEAVGVLTGLGIVDGRTDTEIVPEATYNRAEAAKIIAYMLLGKDQADALKATVAPFEDVSVDFWAAGYIAYCAELGIISGMTETTFEPYGTLTGYQWAKMLLVAVGYGKNGEFEGDSWSLNTATVVAKTGLNEGDLAAADHVALRREQAMLFAFNALNLKQVTYSPNSTNYVYDIWGYVFADGTGTTLGEEVYNLAKVEGMVIDNEGMGASATYVDPTNAWAKTVKISADTGLDVMYHAVRVWYTEGKTNTGVYVNDLAETTATNCPTPKNITDSKADTDKYAEIGEVGIAYELYEIDNSALDLDDYTVVLNVAMGNYGYADPALKTTTINTTATTSGVVSVKTADVLSDVSKIKYADSVLFLLTNSIVEAATNEALYVAAVTGTVGTVQSFAKDGGKFTVTLTDGTELHESNFHSVANDDAEFYRIGQTFTFYLDTHGDVIKATRDGARTLYVYTGETRNTGDWNASSADQGKEFLFLNVTTGEPMWADVYSTNFNNGWQWWVNNMERGTYVDISTGTNADGQHRAEIITWADNTYAAGYVVDNATTVVSGNDEFFALKMHGKDIYYNEDTVTFLVATGRGSNMKINEYVGTEAFKAAMGVPSNGEIELENTALTVSKTVTGDWEATVVFVLQENVATTSRYVFIANDIDLSDWSEVTGDVSNYIITYKNAYMNGEQTSIKLNLDQLRRTFGRNGEIDRGFYILETSYNINGTPTYTLGERIDNGWGNCYYDNARFTATGSDVSTTGWKLNGHSVSSDVKIVDTTNPTHEVTSVYQAWVWTQNHNNGNGRVAFTVDPNTDLVDVIYMVDAGWDAKVTMSLTDELWNAGWRFYEVNGNKVDDDAQTLTWNDANAESLVDRNINVTIYNANLDGFSNGNDAYHINVDIDNDDAAEYVADGKLTNGYIGFLVDVHSMVLGEKDNTFVFGGLNLGDVTVTLTNTKHEVYVAKSDSFEDVVLGESIKVAMIQSNSLAFEPDEDLTDPIWTGKYTTGAMSDVELTGELSVGDWYVTVEVTPVENSVSISSGTWVQRPLQ